MTDQAKLHALFDFAVMVRGAEVVLWERELPAAVAELREWAQRNDRMVIERPLFGTGWYDAVLEVETVGRRSIQVYCRTA